MDCVWVLPLVLEMESSCFSEPLGTSSSLESGMQKGRGCGVGVVALPGSS
jgi:hypothetical protein